VRDFLGAAIWTVVLFFTIPFLFVGLFFLTLRARRQEHTCERD